MLYLFLYALLTLPTTWLQAEVGCMDNSKHLDTRDGYDYKKYHYVFCTCPCDRYYHSYDRGICDKCRHYRAPKDICWAKWRSDTEECGQ